MSDCNLDGVNMCCWTHGVDIDSADYAEGYCAQGWWEHENEAREDEDFEDGPRWDDDEAGRVAANRNSPTNECADRLSAVVEEVRGK